MTIKLIKKKKAVSSKGAPPNAVNMEPPYGDSLITALFGPTMWPALLAADITVKPYHDKVEIGDANSETVIQTVHTLWNTPAKAVSGGLGHLAKETLKASMAKALTEVMAVKGVHLLFKDNDGNNEPIPITDAELNPPEPAEPTTLSMLPPVPEESTTPTLPVALWSPCSLDVMKNGARVILRDATKLYQPVFATTPTSRYFVVAGSPGLKVAACYKTGKSLSVRVEGDDLPQHIATLTAVGFATPSMSAKGIPYTSMHLSLEGQHPSMVSKTIGSIIAAIGAEWQTPVPQGQKLLDAVQS